MVKVLKHQIDNGMAVLTVPVPDGVRTTTVMVGDPKAEVTADGNKVNESELKDWFKTAKNPFVQLHPVKELYQASLQAEFTDEPTT